MAFARRALTVLIAVALAVLPLGAAPPGMAAPAASAASALTIVGHAMSRDRPAAVMAAAAETDGAKHCERNAADSNCCDDDGSCAQSCPQKCFGQTAVMPSERNAGQAVVPLFAALVTDRPTGRSSPPQPPPPRA